MGWTVWDRAKLIACLSPAAKWFANHACDECRDPSHDGYFAEAYAHLRMFTASDIAVYGRAAPYTPDLVRRTVEQAKRVADE
jgi:hypothetical protein